MGKKELRSMTNHRGVWIVLALSALLGLSAPQAQAETIMMSISVDGGVTWTDLSTFGGVGSARGYTMNDTALSTLNTFLAGNSIYQFGTTGATTLGGTSNFPGSTTGQLTLTGEIASDRGVDASHTNDVRIVETEEAFTSPTGQTGLLTSSGAGNFVLQPAGAGHTSQSSVNGTIAGSYTIVSTRPGANAQVGGAFANLPSPTPTVYTLTNQINFNLNNGSTASPVSDAFSVQALVIASGATVPEPASLVLMLTGIPIPLVLIGMLSRRQASA
jgi:hypothetical protein